MESDYVGNAGESFRYAGVIMIITIEYDGVVKLYGNEYSDVSGVQWTMRVARVPQTQYRSVATEYVGSDRRITRNSHGLNIVMMAPTGQIGVFSFQLVLLQIAATFSLFAAATFLIDFVILHLPRSTRCCNQSGAGVRARDSLVPYDKLKYLDADSAFDPSADSTLQQSSSSPLHTELLS